jgi:2,3,4,5-tetrahydropyridine-2-carboxylate N-succinyltransferase
MNPLQTIIEQAWENRALLQETTTTDAIREVIELLDTGNYVEPVGEGWQVNEWLRKRSLCTSLFKMETWESEF